MKKLFFSFALLFFVSNIEGQIPFAPLGAKFYYVANIPIFYFTEEVTKDTIIQGKYCTVIDFMIGPGCNDADDELIDNYYVHQEGEKVYLYDDESSGFQLIYDFDLQANDSYKVKVCHEFWGTDSITVYVLENDNDTQYLEIVPDDPWGLVIDATIKRGIGNTLNVLLLLPPWHDTWGTLLCYETPSTGVIHVQGNNCISALYDKPEQEIDISIWPNPANNNIYMKFTSPISNHLQWTLIDQLGRTMKQEILVAGQQEQEIELEEVGAGLYFWKLSAEEGSLATGKLMVLK